MLLEINVDRFILFISLLNRGIIHYLCHKEIRK